MPITQSDIKLLESERMSDTTDGGGRRTNRVIPDGIAGNIFPKVSRLDGVYGRVNLRKVYGTVQTPDLDTYAGSHAVVTDAPDNDRIHVALFSTASEFDTRVSARDRIESYVTSGPESRMVLYGRQLVGQQAVLTYQRIEEPLPEIGEVFCLSKEPSAILVDYQQYVKITEVSDEIRTFTDDQGDFQRRVVTMKIGSPLRFEFAGPETPSRQSNVPRGSKIRVTTVADAARYYGIQKLTVATLESDLTMLLASVYTPIVPTINRESAVSLASVAGATQYFAAGHNFSVVPGQYLTGNFYFGAPIAPGSFRWFYQGVEIGVDVNGEIVWDAGSWFDGQPGTVDSEAGRVVTPTISWFSDTNSRLEAQHAVAIGTPAHTRRIEITLATRGTVYAETLNPVPAPGTAIVDYRALGKWYRLRDDGSGQLVGADPSVGVGSVDFVTGALVVTLGALPDVESSIVLSWGSTIHYAVRAGATADAGAHARQYFTLQNLPVERGSVTISYTASGGATFTAVDDSNGNITAVGASGLVGRIDYENGDVELRYTSRNPKPGTVINVDYDQVQPATGSEPIPPRIAEGFNTGATIQLSNGVEPGTLTMYVPFRVNSVGFHRQDFTSSAVVKDDGAGLVYIPAGTVIRNGNYSGTAGSGSTTASQNIGTINYSTGEVTFTTNLMSGQVRVYNFVPGESTLVWMVVDVNLARIEPGTGNATYIPAGANTVLSSESEEFTFTEAPLTIDLTLTSGDPVVPNSVRFTIGPNTYYDRNGSIVANPSPTTGSATPAGTIDYETGRCALTLWPDSDAVQTFAVQSCVTQYGDFVTGAFSFRTVGSPIRPASLYVQATSTFGELLTGTSDQNGLITGPKCRGQVNQTMGVAFVEFGQLLTAAGNEAEPWYDPANVEGAFVWRPEPILPSTFRYNAVVLTSLPLNAELLGLDPVRLPSDGRVPIYRPGDVVVVHNTKQFDLPNPAVAGATYSAPRTDLSEFWLVDQTNVRIPTDRYTVDLAAGELTMADPLSLGGYVQPLVAKHRVEEMQLVSDVQINGAISLSAPLTRDYDNDDTFVSSALLFGDLNARVTGVFDQNTWTGAWSDTRIGDQATAQYNDIDYPIEVLNNGAVTERWRIHFTSTTAFQVIGENLGVIGTGTTGDDFSLVNTLTGQPYFVIRAAGWGGGWSVGNQLRFNTIGATAPIWIARTILPGATLNGDSFDMQVRGDVDAE